MFLFGCEDADVHTHTYTLTLSLLTKREREREYLQECFRECLKTFNIQNRTVLLED